MQNPLVNECQYLYPDGRRCRRVPKRGETLCRDHKRARCLTHAEDAAFCRHVQAYADRLIALPLQHLVGEVEFALAGMQPLIESRFRRTHRLLFSRAEIAIAALLEELQSRPTPPPPPGDNSSRSACGHAQQNQMHPSHPGGSPRPCPTPELPQMQMPAGRQGGCTPPGEGERAAP